MGMYLASSQFYSRGEGAARVLTFGGVEAADVVGKKQSRQD